MKQFENWMIPIKTQLSGFSWKVRTWAMFPYGRGQKWPLWMLKCSPAYVASLIYTSCFWVWEPSKAWGSFLLKWSVPSLLNFQYPSLRILSRWKLTLWEKTNHLITFCKDVCVWEIYKGAQLEAHKIHLDLLSLKDVFLFSVGLRTRVNKMRYNRGICELLDLLRYEYTNSNTYIQSQLGNARW